MEGGGTYWKIYQSRQSGLLKRSSNQQNFIRAGYAITDIHKMSYFSTKEFYNKFERSVLEGRKLTCNNMGLPMWVFMLQLPEQETCHSR
ncbi:hypothetical protein KY284_036377 [Solanum tuberosum]|nr:hypothetical protein KY284_036377 [Solanum tuberosum]